MRRKLHKPQLYQQMDGTVTDSVTVGAWSRTSSEGGFVVQRGELTSTDRDRLLRARDAVGEAEAELRAAAAEANGNGGSVRMIAELVGVSPTTVQKWIRKA